MIKTILYILLFAIVTMIIYTWGLLKQRGESANLINILYSKGEKKIIKLIKKKGPMTRKELEVEISGLKASLFYSKQKIIVKDSKLLTKNLLNNMVEKDALVIDNTNMPRRYNLK